jgi:hypothetical protein
MSCSAIAREVWERVARARAWAFSFAWRLTKATIKSIWFESMVLQLLSISVNYTHNCFVSSSTTILQSISKITISYCVPLLLLRPESLLA